jgi:hypothetical protein
MINKGKLSGGRVGKRKIINRRDFMKNSTLAAIGSTIFLGKKGIVFPAQGPKTKVILVRDNNVLDHSGKPKYEVVLDMLDKAVTTLTGERDVVQAWKTFIRPDDVVGIKSNVWTYIPTTPQVENALKKRVMDAGVDESNIGIDDRGVLRNPLFKRTTALINARPMRSHHWSGVGSLIKNYIMFIPDPPNYHGDSCARLATIWDNPLCKGKTRLNILVMLTPQFHGVGPHNFNPRYVWKYYGLIVSFDPVAADSTGLRIIQAKRKEFFVEDRPLSPPAKHIFEADIRYNLGTSDPNKIELIKIGYQEDIYV